ncbi:hypothetical protein, partial [Streptomyces sp. 150FB]|uniref:hypothetical protein n=1 Tax=Streptomyces sp. 150FB TaxID=1576605 RepID=UPI000588F597
PLRLAESGGWRDTALVLPEGRWGDAFGSPGREFEGGPGHPVAPADLFAERPVALLSRRA